VHASRSTGREASSRRIKPKRRGPLTKREAELLDLVGHGVSNPESAAPPFTNRKTAEHHVRHIF
jgi:DNA-binding CsgD family transcriptional regulator